MASREPFEVIVRAGTATELAVRLRDLAQAQGRPLSVAHALASHTECNTESCEVARLIGNEFHGGSASQPARPPVAGEGRVAVDVSLDPKEELRAALINSERRAEGMAERLVKMDHELVETRGRAGEAEKRKNELWAQSLAMAELAKKPGTPEELQALRLITRIAQDASTQFQDWRGHASTINATDTGTVDLPPGDYSLVISGAVSGNRPGTYEYEIGQ